MNCDYEILSSNDVGEYIDKPCPNCDYQVYMLVRERRTMRLRRSPFGAHYSFHRRCKKCHDIKMISTRRAVKVMYGQMPWWKGLIWDGFTIKVIGVIVVILLIVIL